MEYKLVDALRGLVSQWRAHVAENPASDESEGLRWCIAEVEEAIAAPSPTWVETADKFYDARIKELEADLWAVREAYNELIMAVGKKHPGETRHQTALRYIQQAERPTEAVVSQQAADHTPQAPAAEPGGK